MLPARSAHLARQERRRNHNRRVQHASAGARHVSVRAVAAAAFAFVLSRQDEDDWNFVHRLLESEGLFGGWLASHVPADALAAHWSQQILQPRTIAAANAHCVSTTRARSARSGRCWRRATAGGRCWDR
ncbi:MAG: VgrG protein [uncultured Paraburkholderia sp.]|nr:MAG: VgrG protein [uncultured Paraburkholderia sp.]CAH2909519.1 MAG: VgrG protein [uncultured Paraburkholderia sp.]